MLIKTLVIIVIAALVYFIVAAIRSKKKPQPVETVVEPETPPPAEPQHMKEVQAIVDRYRREIETNEKSEGCKALGLCVVGKVEEVTSKVEHQDVNRYWQSMMIRLEAFRAAYRGEPSYQFNCNVSRGVEFSNTLIDAILELHPKD